jgi:hypothetical protein
VDSIYTLMSTMIVQIYQLYVSVPTASLDQIKRISIFMDALEQVSEIWLVVKAVQDLLESVLSFAGYERSLDTASGSIYQKRIGPAPAVKKEATPGNGPSLIGGTEPSKTMPLTRALRTWANVALKSAVTPKTATKSPTVEEMSSNSSISSKQSQPRLFSFSANWKDYPQEPFVQPPPIPPGPGFGFEPMYEYLPPIPAEQNLAWNPQWIDGAPAPTPTGFNAAEW